MWSINDYMCFNFPYRLVSLSPCRLFSIISLCLAVLVKIQLMRDVALFRSRGVDLCQTITTSLCHSTVVTHKNGSKYRYVGHQSHEKL